MSTADSMDEMKEICSMCNHNRVYHTYIKEMAITVCKVKACKCIRNVPTMMTYSTKVLEDLR